MFLKRKFEGRIANIMLTARSFSISLGPTPFDILHNGSEATLEMLPDHCTNTLEKDGRVH